MTVYRLLTDLEFDGKVRNLGGRAMLPATKESQKFALANRELMMFALASLGATPDWNAFYRAIRDIRDHALADLEMQAVKQWRER